MGTFNITHKENLTLLTDFYELTMSQAYFDQGLADTPACFDLYFRRIPQQGGFVLMCGLSEVIEYLKNWHFSQEDIRYLRESQKFSEAFLTYLSQLQFSCDIWAIPEGTPVFPNEPLVKVSGPLVQAQLIETMLLLCINHQSLIATKAARIKYAAKGRKVLEFGARRAQGTSAALFGSRAAYIGGVEASSCTLAGSLFHVPVSGTMAHSFILAFDSEYEAFASYVKTYPDDNVLLVDTYNTLQSGVPNAIRIAKEILEPQGKRLKGIRIDSGDLAYLSQKARKLLDEAGCEDCQIIVSNSLDEYIISDLIHQQAKVDAFGVGEQLITSRAEPVLGGVYKLACIAKEGKWQARLKMSNNPEKITTPGSKQVLRFYSKTDHMALADLVILEGETIPQGEAYEIFHPIHTWKRTYLEDYEVEMLLKPVFLQGKCVYPELSLEEIRQYSLKTQAYFWESYKRFENPETYRVDLSQELWDLKNDLLHAYRKEKKV